MEALLDSEANSLEVEFRDKLFRQTSGHPLFTIELLRGMQERGDLVRGKGGLWGEAPGLDWETMPARVEAVMAERINRLDPSLQAALEVACVEGETFTLEVVERVLGADGTDLGGRINIELDRKHRLIKAHSIQRIDGQLISCYRFRHILAQKYLYGRLNELERVRLHEGIGTNLEALYGAREAATGEEIAAIAPQLARHFKEAKITTKAINYLRQAGEKAISLSAYRDGIAHLSNGISMLNTLPESRERDELELELQLSLGIAWLGPYGGQDQRVKSTLTRAHDLCQKLGKTSRMAHVTSNLSTYYYVRAEYKSGLELAQLALGYAEQFRDPLLIAQGNWTVGYIMLSLGELSRASKHLEAATAFYDPQKHHEMFLSIRGADAGVSALAYSACCLWVLGYPDQAMAHSRESLAVANELDHPFSLTDVVCYGGCLFNAMYRDDLALKEYADQLFQLASFKHLAGWLGVALSHRGNALARLGRLDEGIAMMLDCVADAQSSGIRLYMIHTYLSLAEAYAQTGETKSGLEYLKEAIDLVEETGERLREAEIYRMQAELLRIDGDLNAAEGSYHTALEVARAQSAKSWELRAATGLARLWKDAEIVEEARSLLEGIYAWFTEGFDSPDLVEARALLEVLS